MSYYLINGVDISNLLQPYSSGVKTAATGFKINGVDLNEYYSPIGFETLSANTGYSFGGSELKNIFSAKLIYSLTGTYNAYKSNGYTVVVFTNTGTITFSKPKTVNYILVSGGDSGGLGSNVSQLGGLSNYGGYPATVSCSSTTVNADQQYPVTIGLGVNYASTANQTTSFGNISVGRNNNPTYNNSLPIGNGLSGLPGTLLPTDISVIINGTTYTHLGGGGGYGGVTNSSSVYSGGAGGLGGGGAGGATANPPANASVFGQDGFNGTPNTGGGGGGGGGNWGAVTSGSIFNLKFSYPRGGFGGSGGSGVVVLYFSNS